MRKTLQELNYTFPDKCCGNCHHSYRNEYGDFQCHHVTIGDVIDLGGICDEYNAVTGEDGVPVHVDYDYRRTVVLNPWLDTVEEKKGAAKRTSDCPHCTYGFLDARAMRRCAIGNKMKEVCHDFTERDTAVNGVLPGSDVLGLVESVEVGAIQEDEKVPHICATCAGSFFNEFGIPMCRIDNVTFDDAHNEIDPNGTCEYYIKEGHGSVGFCIDCKRSYYDDRGIARCSLDCSSVVAMVSLRKPCNKFEPEEASNA